MFFQSTGLWKGHACLFWYTCFRMVAHWPHRDCTRLFLSLSICVRRCSRDMSSGFGGTPPDLPPVSDDFLFTPRFPSSDLRDLPAPDLRFDSFTSTR